MTQQQVSLFVLQYHDDTTDQLLYEVMKEALAHEIHNEEATVNVLVDVCNNTRDQFKRIMDALDNDNNTKRARLLAGDGLLYTQTCIHKYTQSEVQSMPEPLALPQTVVEGTSSSSSRSSSSKQNPLRAIEPEKEVTDMEWAKAFYEEYKTANKRINWQVC